MKKTTLLSVPLILISLGLAVKADATTTQSSTSQGIVGFSTGGGTQSPVDPNLPDPTLPVTPQNPDGSTPNPGGDGPLTIDFASSFDFGTHDISNQDQTYVAKAQRYFNSGDLTPNYVQVTDRRGTFSGWELKVMELTQFTQISTGPQKYRELKGSTISLKNPIPASLNGDNAPSAQAIQSLIPGVETQIALAVSGKGAGTWVVRWGSQENITQEGLNPEVTLFVPGATPKDATAYQTTLNWILSDLPKNTPA
ncbi:WxL domain-containing protein [Pseudolactococcus reticulitermitis]|uniref:WxL domain-containing protein n=1 Tax=Pseudolactococcus reticulitermitis TaxID=2025039 RepID=A0A224X1H7_9LACT|nr:WxL domain-containing protein [Lactococcus reticulitermitis]GAX48038.1 hypothetical protein RsY01_1652 [Lactococcus reticulitermitis]GHU35455.1 hypothetical protein FACS1894192_00110 [Bacilli bacterium]GHU42694.1 hypothetical protein FACS1894193_08460 [Bacilli bacterium]